MNRPAPSARVALPASADVALPPQVEERLREKLRYMESDFRLDPRNGPLMVRLVETHAGLAVLLREKKRDESMKHLVNARQLEQKLARIDPALALGVGYVRLGLDRLGWAGANGGMMLPQMMTGDGRGISPTLRSTSSQTLSSPGAPYPGQPPGVTPPGAPPMGLSQAPLSTQPLRMGDSPGAAPPQGASPPPASSTSSLMPPGMPFGPSTLRSEEEQKAEIRSRIKSLILQRSKEPRNTAVYDNLGTAYQQLAELESDARKRRKSADLKSALEAFKVGLKLSRLRIHKAAFLRACGDVYEDQGDYEKQYQVTLLAVQQTPYSPTVWDELRNAALRSGHYAESRRAGQKVRDWTLPTVRAQ